MNNIEEKLENDLNLYIPSQEEFDRFAEHKKFFEDHRLDVTGGRDASRFFAKSNKKAYDHLPWFICSELFYHRDNLNTLKIFIMACLFKWDEMLKNVQQTIHNLRVAKRDITNLMEQVWKPNIAELTQRAKNAEVKARNFYEALEEPLDEDVELHNTLNPKIWNEDTTLKSEVEEKINEIVDKFLKGLKDDDVELKVDDIVLVGSNCAYNYTDNSDLDIHIIADMKNKDDLYAATYAAYRSIWNNKHDTINFYGIPVELFVETNADRIDDAVENVEESLEDTKRLAGEEKEAIDSYDKSIENADTEKEAELYKHIKSEEEEHLEELNDFAKGEPVDLEEAKKMNPLHSAGIYSVKHKKWLKEPVRADIPEIDNEEVNKQTADWTAKCEEVAQKADVETIKEFIDELYAYRQDGINKDGEFSVENLVFKNLRNAGHIDNLKNLKSELEDKALSLDAAEMPVESDTPVTVEEPVVAEESLTESQSQEIGGVYSSLSKKLGIDFDELVYGEDGFMADCYPAGFPDFAGDVIYSEKYWDELAEWALSKYGININMEVEYIDDDTINEANDIVSIRKKIQDFRIDIQRSTRYQPIIFENGIFEINNIGAEDIDRVARILRTKPYVDPNFSKIGGRFDFRHAPLPGKLPDRIYTIRGHVNFN